MYRRDYWLIVACLVVGLAALCLHGHCALENTGWASACRHQVSPSYVVHMAELQFRRLAAVAGQYAAVR
jgi:hypothetical protein